MNYLVLLICSEATSLFQACENDKYPKLPIINEPRHVKTGFLHMRKTKTQISFAIAAKLISAFVFATQIVQTLYFLNPKFQASSHISDCTALFVSDLVGNPEDWFSHNEAQICACQN